MQKIQELIADYLNDAFIRQSHNSVIWIPFFLAIGIGIYFSIKIEPHISYLILLLSVVGALTIMLGRYRYALSAINYIFWGALAGLIILMGFTAATFRTQAAYTPMIEKKINYANVIGDIEMIEPLESGSRVLLSNLEIEDMPAPPRKIRVKIRDDDGLTAGQRISFLAGLNPPSPPVAPGAFDFQRWAYFQGIGAVGFSYGRPEIQENVQASVLSQARESIKDTIIDETKKPGQSVMLALMTGQRKAIIEEDWEAMRNSGLAHMLAISGLHVGMVAGVLFFFSRLLMAAIEPLALRYPIKKYAAVIAIIGAFLYMLMVGATIPTQRAMIMTGLAMLAICLDRSPFSLRLVGIAAIIILLYRPESLVSVSFQMSFAAVTALVAFYEVTRKYWRNFYSRAGMMRKIALYFIGLSTTTIIAGTVTGFFALYHFNQYAMYGLLANLIAVPILAFIVMPLLVLSYVLMPLGLSFISLSIAEYGVEWILATAHWVANMEGAVFYLPSFPSWLFTLSVIALWCFAIWKGPEKKALLPLFVVFMLTFSLVKKPDIHISDKSELIAVQDREGHLLFSSLQSNRYIADQWQKRNGDQSASYKSKWSKAPEDISCDDAACRYQKNDQNISIVSSKTVLKEECEWADMIISDQPLSSYNCRKPILIDRFDTHRNGAHSIWLTKDKIIVKNVSQGRGERPWTNP